MRFSKKRMRFFKICMRFDKKRMRFEKLLSSAGDPERIIL